MTTAMHIIPAAFTRAATLETTHSYMGSLMSFLTTGAETGGCFALMEYRGRPGNEPPPHIHLWENEIVYVLDGIMELYSGDRIMLLHPGEMGFIPRGQPHGFYIRTPEFRALAAVQSVGEQPVALDAFFRRMSTPAATMALPTEAITYQTEDPALVVEIAAEHGMQILSHEEAAIALPLYPGFGHTDRGPGHAQDRRQSLAAFGASPATCPLAASGAGS